MPKAEPLTIDTLSAPQITPKAATPARSPGKSASPLPEPKAEQVPLQVRIPRGELLDVCPEVGRLLRVFFEGGGRLDP